jgi:putative tryptophan/tyrosine transport system substrate-binding protein
MRHDDLHQDRMDALRRTSNARRALTRGDRMSRRAVVVGFGCAAVWSLAGRAHQPGRTPVIGLLSSVSFESYAERIEAIREGLKQAGIEEKNVAFEYRAAAGRIERLPELAAELVRQGVDVIVTVGGDPPARAAQAATSTIPIVVTTGSDPSDFGLVANLNKPEANITGVSFFAWELGPKRLQLLHELLPKAKRFALLMGYSAIDPRKYVEEFEEAARNLGVETIAVTAQTPAAIDEAFAAFAAQGIAGLVVSNDAFLNSCRKQVVGLAERHSVPAIYPYREHVQAGGLMSYGTEVLEMYREAGGYTARILAGAKPGDLPVLLPTKYEMLINLKTARLLGLDVPRTLIFRTDEVVE